MTGRKGRTKPRLFTKPLVTGPAGECGCGCAHTRATTLGFDVAEFAELIGIPLFPWQRWLVIHAMEHTEGIPRFRTVLVLVARQNGKTRLLNILTLYWMYVQRVRFILGTSTSLDTARETWQQAVDIAEDHWFLSQEIEQVRYTNGQQELGIKSRSRYKIAAANRSAARGLTIDRLIVDELREHRDFEAWAAMAPTVGAVPGSQIWALSNAGDDSSVVLNQFQAKGRSGEMPSLGLFEWSAQESATLDDWDAIAQANPSLGYGTLTVESIESMKIQPPAKFRTEHMCIRVPNLDEAISLQAWQDCFDEAPLDKNQGNIHLALDISPGLSHATLVAAQVTPGGKTRVEVIGSWTDTKALRADLPDLIARVKPKSLGWIANSPTAALKADLARIKSAVSIPGPDVLAACQGFAEQVSANQILHNGDPLLTGQLANSAKLSSGDGWRFTRKGSGDVDASYAVAVAVHLARTQKPSLGKPRIITANNRIEESWVSGDRWGSTSR